MLRCLCFLVFGSLWMGVMACSPDMSGSNKEQHGTEKSSTDVGSSAENPIDTATTTDTSHDAGSMTDTSHDAGSMTDTSYDAGSMTDTSHEPGGVPEKPSHTDSSPTDKSSHDAGSPTSCKHDCDCVKTGWVCDGSECKPLRRLSLCLPCDGDCKVGDPCLQENRNIGVCKPTPPSCTTDCDCKPSEGVCHEGKCNPTLKRAYMCPFCDDKTNCPAGKPCRNQDGSLGRCPIPCKHDCDCFGTGLLCDGTTCIPLRRISFCLDCDGGNCKPGDPCLKKDQTIGVCPAQTFACGAKSCKLGQEYCSTVVGGARPTCDVLPPVTGNCPTGCSDAGLHCTDGKTRCTCPSTQCNALPTGCSNCTCLTSRGSVPQGACQCSEQNGAIEVKCFAP